MIVWFMHKCTEFPLPIVMKLANAQHDVQISDTEFHSNQTVSEENMEVDSCPELKYGLQCDSLHKLTAAF